MKQKNLFSVIFTIIIVFSTIISSAQTATWNGSVSNDWNDTLNWDEHIVPDQNFDVVIPSNYTNKLYVTSLESAKSIDINANAELEIGFGGSIAVQNDFNIYGTLLMTDGSISAFGTGHLYANGVLIINKGTVSSSTAILDSLSTTKYIGIAPTIYNWDYGILIIDATDTALLESSFASPTKCDKLIVNTPIKITDDKALYVEDTIVNNYGNQAIILSGGTEGTGAIIHNTTNISGEVRIISSAKNVAWHYISSPATGVDISQFETNVYVWDASVSWAGLGDYSPWGLVNSGNMEIGRGYAMQIDPNTIIFKGMLNVDNFDVTLYKNSNGDADNQGWNLIGNPFAAPIDWDQIVAGNFIDADVENAVYFFDDNDQSGNQSNYRYYVPSTGGTYGVGTNDASAIIPVGQGFFVKTNTDNTTITLHKSCRAFVKQAFYKNLKEPQTLRLTISDGISSDELVYRIVDDATVEFDTKYDARKIISADSLLPEIFSLGKQLPYMAINSIAEPTENTSLNIGIKGQAGHYSINLTEYKLTNQDVYLIDKYKKTFVNLLQKQTYEFYHFGGYVTDRFEIVFHTPQTTDFETQNSFEVNIYPNPASNYIKINGLSDNDANVKIFSETGQLVVSQHIDNERNTVNVNDLTSGLYYVQIVQESKTSSYKFIKN